MSDTGKYTCVAVNAAGEKQRDMDLRVYGETSRLCAERDVKGECWQDGEIDLAKLVQIKFYFCIMFQFDSF